MFGASMSSKFRPLISIVSPALAAANNGNWHTAWRWSRMLAGNCRTAISTQWTPEANGADCAALIALHARRSAASVDAFARAYPQRPLIVVLTGTDLYRDIRIDSTAQRSLQQASHLVVLQGQGVEELEPALRAKCSVIYQSAPRLRAGALPKRVLRVVQVAHLRDEKDPATFMRAARRLQDRSSIHFEHIGDALDATLGAAARRTQADCPHYRWLGALPRPVTRRHIQGAHLLVSTSKMEGGAHVILEAAQSGTAVLASRVAGNVGMLGPGHAGYFDLGDDSALAALIARARDDVDFLATLCAQTIARAALFEPAEEKRRLLNLIQTALENAR
jgi:putative glycosyltransferase (TIGR04348 family)